MTTHDVVHSIHPYTSLGWEFDGIEKAVDDLTSKGALFERLDGLPQELDRTWT